MLKVGNKIIHASVIDILKRFREYAFDNNIKVFEVIENNGSDIRVTCPNRKHKNMQERNPSCFVANRDLGDVREGTFHCFSCGYKAFIDYTFSQIMGIHDDGEWGRSWIFDNFLNTSDDTRELDLNIQRQELPNINIVSEEVLDSYRYSHPYWKKRKIDEQTAIRFDLGYDKDSKSITMPCWDYKGNCIGVTKRKVNSKWFYIPEGVTKPVYLLNYAIKEGWKEIYLCESQINALYLNSLGYNSCACFGTGSEQQAKDLRRCGVRSVVFCFDGDDAGRKGRERMAKKLIPEVICSYVDLPDGKDINDLSPEEVKSLLKIQKFF